MMAPAEASEIPDFADLLPAELMADPARIWAAGPRGIASQALAYTHATGARSYDELGFRWSAAVPIRTHTPLQTVPRMRVLRARELEGNIDPRLARVRAEQLRLRHRPLDLPNDGRFRYESTSDLLHFTRQWTDRAGRPQEDVWTFPLTAPPRLIAEDTREDDEAVLAGHRLRVELPAMRWLPLRRVIQGGVFPRMQDCRSALTNEMAPGCFYAFLSHRWLTPTEPDPDGGQARYAAWQLVGNLCDALRVAGQRGLLKPRRSSPQLGFVVGPAGSELAEAMLVNVIRPSLDATTLARALEEIAPLERELSDYGVRLAAADEGLEHLRELLADRPVLAMLVDRMHVWYDYSCLPQAPRVRSDEELFVAGLQHLTAFQVLGRTLVLLDDTEDYLSRGWCTLESLVADSVMGRLDLLVGSERPTAQGGRTEYYFETLLQDRPHLVWRALLDTEVMRVQSPEECMSRLGLSFTDPRDFPLVYDGLRKIRAPVKVHIDPSELWTGVIPVPLAEGGQIAIIPRSGERSLREQPHSQPRSLDWTAALSLDVPDHSPAPAFLELARDGCHVVVLASCEGEAIHFTRWVLRHRDQLGTSVGSMSWLAADIAPVGAMPCGTLHARPVDAPLWVLVGTDQRLDRGLAGPAIVAALIAVGKPYLRVELNRETANLVRVDPEPDTGNTERLPVPTDGFPVHAGGLLREFALQELV